MADPISTISKSSSIRFRQVVDDALPTWENTFVSDHVYRGAVNHWYAQKFYDDDTVTLQCKITNGSTPNLYYSEGNKGAWTAYDSSRSLEGDYSDYDFYEWTIDFSDFSSSIVRFKVVGGTRTWISEPCEILSEKDHDNYLQIEWFFNDNTKPFDVDYSTDLAHLIRVDSILKDYEPGGEVSVFDNQNELTKVKDIVQRTLVFKTEPIPAYLAEVLVIAMSADHFYVNEVEFVVRDKPEVENTNDNLVTLTAKLTERNVIGLNTHDIGFDCDSTSEGDFIVNRQETNKSGTGTFSIPAGYAVEYFHVKMNTGSTATFQCGYSAGTYDIIPSVTVPASPGYVNLAADINVADVDNAWTLYYNVSGAGATVDIYLLATRIKDVS